jgi:hypothetical protein
MTFFLIPVRLYDCGMFAFMPHLKVMRATLSKVCPKTVGSNTTLAGGGDFFRQPRLTLRVALIIYLRGV